MSTKQKTEAELLADIQRAKEAEARFKQIYGKDTLFYHTKLDFDPLNRGKRVTICAILVGDEYHLGYSRSHIMDAKIWNKKKGITISHGRATNNPVLKMAVPTERVKHTVIEKAKELARRLIITDKNGEVLTEEQIMDKLNKKRIQFDREQENLDKKMNMLVATTTKVHEFFHPEVPTEPVKTEKVFHELTEN